MATISDKVDPRVVRTRKLIIDAFLSLIAETPFDDITVQDIAAQATVNRATFYAHFEDKYALLDAIIQTGFAQTLARWIAMPTTTPDAYLEHVFLAITEHLVSLTTQCRRSYQTFETLVEAQVKGQVRDHVLACLKAQPRTRATAGPRLEVAATLLSWALYGAALEWKKRGQAQPPEAFGREALPLIAAMVRAVGDERPSRESADG
jgi:AcrR family transcriptional regulator